MANIFEQVKQISAILALVGDLQKLDADGDGVADVKEAVIIGARMMTNFNALQADLAEISALLGDDIEEIKKRFGLDEAPKK